MSLKFALGRLEITTGHVQDSQMMEAFLDWQKEPLAIVADRAYGSERVRQQIADEGRIGCAPFKEQRSQAHSP